MVMMMVMTVVVPVFVLADAAHVVMMSFLRLTDRGGIPGKLHAVFAQLAIHVRAAMNRFRGPFPERIQK